MSEQEGSFLERLLYWFLRTKVFGGLKKVRQREYLPFALLILLSATLNTIIAILYQLDLFFSLEWVQYGLILQLFLSFGLVISGAIFGRVKKLRYYFLGSALIIFTFLFLFFFFDWSYTQNLVQFSKLIYFLFWVTISCISVFFLNLYFFTSFPKKVMMMGSSKSHIFFHPFIKIIIFISIPLYAYIIYQLSPGSFIIGTYGLFVSIILLIFLYRAPRKAEKYPSIVNFASALGFYYFFLFYHLVASFSLTSSDLSSVIVDLFILLVVMLYIIQSITFRITESPERIKSYENPVRFQTRVYLTDRLKKAFGEKGLILMVMGLILGYHMAYLDSLFITEFPLLSQFFTPGIRLSALFHRVYLLVCLIIIVIGIIIYLFSNRFRDLLVDKYTIQQVFRYLRGYFQKTEGGISPFEMGVQAIGKKIGDGIKNWGDKLFTSITNPPKKPEKDENVEE